MRTRLLAALTLGALLTTAGCGASDESPAGGPPAPGGSGGTAVGTVTVLAASSLTESFTALGTRFEQLNPAIEVTFSFGGSSGLAQQIVSGAPADVFAAASPATMKTVVDAGAGAGTPVVFARNQLVIAVPKGNPKALTSLAALAAPGVKVALCAEQVPCGAAARKALDAAGVQLTPVTEEQDVKAALAKVKLGEVDAALVYRTDTRAAAKEVDGIDFPESATAINDYPIVALADAAAPPAAAAFVAFVQTPDARHILTDAGFRLP
jgi:molybdate transport system substrate-binding protein